MGPFLLPLLLDLLLHYEIRKYCQSTSRVQASVLISECAVGFPDQQADMNENVGGAGQKIGSYEVAHAAEKILRLNE